MIVQPSFYGADNSATLDALDALGGQGRGVAVIDPSKALPDTLDDYHQRGVRGLRLNLYSPIKAPGGDTLDVGLRRDARPPPRMMGWHVQVIAPLPVLLANLPMCLAGAGAGRHRPLRALRRADAGQRRRPPPARSRCAARMSG